MNFTYRFQIFVSKYQFWLFGVRSGPTLTLKGPKCTKRSTEENKTISHMVLGTDYGFSKKIANFSFQGSILGQNCVIIGPKCPENAILGINKEIMPFFNTA